MNAPYDWATDPGAFDPPSRSAIELVLVAYGIPAYWDAREGVEVSRGELVEALAAAAR